jgi:hypothetical protein
MRKEHGAWSEGGEAMSNEHGAWSGKAAWSREHGAESGKAAWSKEHGAESDTSDVRSVECLVLSFELSFLTYGVRSSIEQRAWSMERRGSNEQRAKGEVLSYP